MATGVLVLDQSHRPVDHIPVVEAASKLACREAFPLAGATIIATFHSPSTIIEVPSIICLKVFVPIPKKLSRHITNRLLFARDDWTCQYCDRHKNELPEIRVSAKRGKSHKSGKNMKKTHAHTRPMKLTRDHVKPISSFPGKTRAEKSKLANTWDNVVTACEECNSRKGDLLPMQAGMYPLRTPKRPSGVLITVVDKLDTEQLAFVGKKRS